MPTVLVAKAASSDEREEFQVKEGEILFDQLDAQGKTLPHGCLAGSCGSCRIEVIEGAENLSEPGAIETDTLKALQKSYTEKYGAEFIADKTLRLSCRARVNGNVKICAIKG